MCLFRTGKLIGQVPEWPKGADCKSAVTDFDGSNPSLPTIFFAGMAELADALDSGSSEGNFMQVQVLFPAPRCRGRVIVRGTAFLFSSPGNRICACQAEAACTLCTSLRAFIPLLASRASGRAGPNQGDTSPCLFILPVLCLTVEIRFRGGIHHEKPI